MNSEQEPVAPLSWDETLESLRREAAAFEIGDAAAAEAYRLRFLSKKGEVTRLFEAFRALSGPEKKSVGQALNALRTEVEERWKQASAGTAQPPPARPPPPPPPISQLPSGVVAPGTPCP